MAETVQSSTVQRVVFVDSEVSRAAVAGAMAVARGYHDVEWLVNGGRERDMPECALSAVKEAGLSLDDVRIVSEEELKGTELDLAVVLCAEAEERCGLLLGRPTLVRWDLGTPPGDHDRSCPDWMQTIAQLQRLVGDLLEHGFLESMLEARGLADEIIGCVTDGIVVHDLNRRIVFFNSAAEAITGYRRELVLNRDCHHVFHGPLCGDQCSFPDGVCVVSEFEGRDDRIEVTDANGDKRLLDMTIRPLRTARGKFVGVVNAFRDVTRETRMARDFGEIEGYSGIIGSDPKMREVFDLISDVADTYVPVLIQGESGTGKELVAAAIHNEGPRSHKQFVPVNCGALPEGLLESELFGHVKGSFTGAVRDKKGRFELADGGTIFLDEIGDVPPAMQVRLLRVLQEGKFERVGSEETLHVDVRVISATHKNLMAEIADKRFREDLYYRLNVFPIWLPPLRERASDIPQLVNHILERFCYKMEREMVYVSEAAMKIMVAHDWPGNVRELQNWLQFALVKCRDNEIQPHHLPPLRMAAPSRIETTATKSKLTRQSVSEALQRTEGNKVEAAKLLDVSRATLYRFLNSISD